MRRNVIYDATTLQPQSAVFNVGHVQPLAEWLSKLTWNIPINQLYNYENSPPLWCRGRITAVPGLIPSRVVFILFLPGTGMSNGAGETESLVSFRISWAKSQIPPQ